MDDPRVKLSGDQVAALDGLADWQPVYGALETRFRTGDFATGLALVNRIGGAAEAADHHPDLTLSYRHVNVLLTSHDVGGTTTRDVELARTISAIAAEMGVTAEPGRAQRVEFALDTWDRAEIAPFWAAVLAMKPASDGQEIVDAEGDNPTIWFQDADRSTDQRWHPDIRVPLEEADARIAAAVAAGGTIVSEEAKPRFVVLADPQGNKVCVCTHVGRPA